MQVVNNAISNSLKASYWGNCVKKMANPSNNIFNENRLCIEVYKCSCNFNEMNYTAGGRMRVAARRGQTLVEYALVLALISVVAVGIMINLGKSIKGVYSTITSVVASAQASH
jgi:Flp pilus assembly pilin Flp